MAPYFAWVLAFFLYTEVAFAAFGVTTSGNNFLVDSGAGLVTTSKWLDCVQTSIALTLRPAVNTSNGDLTSLKFNGEELQDQSKFTQLSSGLGSATVTSSVNNNIAIITIRTSTIVCITLPHIYIN